MKTFISYSSIDNEIAKSISQILVNLNVQHFFDKKDINWGDNFSTEITENITSCKSVIVIISPASLKSLWVLFEIGYASALGKIILPFLTHPSLDVPAYLSHLHHIKDLDDLRNHFAQMAINQTDEDNLSKYLARGKHLINAEYYEEAVEQFNEILEIQPDNLGALSCKGDALNHIGFYEEAIDSYTKAIKTDPKNKTLYVDIAYNYNCLNKFQEALSTIEKAITIDPYNIKALMNKVKALGGLNKHKAAMEVTKEVLKIMPLNDMAWSNLGASFGMLGDIKSALKCLKKAMKINPNNEQAKNNIEHFSQLKYRSELSETNNS